MLFRTALFVLPLLAACSTAGDASRQLAASKWSFTAIDGQPPVSSSAELTIEVGRIGANLGCNGLGGELKIGADKLETKGLISTMMYCDGVMEQERAVSALLEASPRYQVDGNTLTLTAPGHSARLTRLR